MKLLKYTFGILLLVLAGSVLNKYVYNSPEKFQDNLADNQVTTVELKVSGMT